MELQNLNKLEFNKSQNEIIIDFVNKSAQDIDTLSFGNVYYVDSSMRMRPDLLAYDINNTTDFSDLLKSNLISNPFTLDENDIILIPNSSNPVIIEPQNFTDSTGQDIRDEYIQPEKGTEIDPTIKKIQNKFEELKNRSDNTSNPSQNNLPPNFNDFGVGEVEIVGGKVKFGPGIARDKAECATEPISKSELISQIVKNKLIRPNGI